MRKKLKKHLQEKTDVSSLPRGWKLIKGDLESFTRNPMKYLDGENCVVVLCYSAHHCYYKSIHAFFNSKIILENTPCIYVLDVVEEHGWTKPFYTWVDCESPENFDNVLQQGLWDSTTLWQEPNFPIEEGHDITNAWCYLRKLISPPTS